MNLTRQGVRNLDTDDRRPKIVEEHECRIFRFTADAEGAHTHRCIRCGKKQSEAVAS